MRLHKNDEVMVMAGKDRGKHGKIQQCLPKENRVLVEGINMIKRHTRPRPNLRQAGIVQSEASIHASNVMLICTHCGKPTRVGYTFLEDGKKVRTCKRCHEEIA